MPIRAMVVPGGADTECCILQTGGAGPGGVQGTEEVWAYKMKQVADRFRDGDIAGYP